MKISKSFKIITFIFIGFLFVNNPFTYAELPTNLVIHDKPKKMLGSDMYNVAVWVPGDAADDETISEFEEEGWNKIEPGGDTICSRGDDFAFAVRKGTSKNIVVDFVGGGGKFITHVPTIQVV